MLIGIGTFNIVITAIISIIKIDFYFLLIIKETYLSKIIEIHY